MTEEKKRSIYECPYMRVPKCFRQDISKQLDTSICIACILGRLEKHLFTISGKNDKQPR